MTSPEPFELNTRTVLAREALDPLATIEFTPERDGVFCGVNEVVKLLRELGGHGYQLATLDEGEALIAGEVALRVRGHFLEYGASINHIAGLVATQSGWATVARVLVDAAKPLPVILTAPSLILPGAAPQFEYAAQVGGCLGSDSLLGKGALSRMLILLMGDSLHALKAMDKAITPNVPRLGLVESSHNPVDEAVRLALGVGDHLAGVLVEQQERRDVLTTAFFREMRAHLDLAGFPRVKMYVGGKVTCEQIGMWMREQAPVNGFFVGDSIAGTKPLPFAIELKESDGKPLARYGLTPGTTPNPRLKRIDVL